MLDPTLFSGRIGDAGVGLPVARCRTIGIAAAVINAGAALPTFAGGGLLAVGPESLRRLRVCAQSVRRGVTMMDIQ